MEEKNNMRPPKTGFLRLEQVLEIIPVGQSTWWKKVKAGEFPPGVKLGPRTTAWRVEDIDNLIVSLSKGEE